MELGRQLWKNFALWSLKCPHVQSLCVYIYTCKHKLTWRVNIMGGGSFVETLAKIFIQNCFMTYCYVCVHTHLNNIYIHSALQNFWFRTKLMWMKNFHLERPSWMAFCYFTKAVFFFPLNLFIFISECFHFFISFSQNLKL